MDQSLALIAACHRSATPIDACRRVLARLTGPPSIAMGVLILSTLDGLATLRLMALGMEEANPVMRALLVCGPGMFLAGKFTLTALGLRVLVAARGRPLFGTQLKTGHVILTLAVLYVLLLVYELRLLAFLAS